jgi:hypothetical protein
MNRGTVMTLNKRTAVVLTPDGQFVHVKRQAHFEVGEEITVAATMRGAPRIRQRLLQAGMFASALLLILVGLSMFRTAPVVAYVSMDINPSIELGLDANQRVRELRALNKDAEAIIEGLKYRGKNLESVMNELARKLVDKHILTLEDGEVVIASVPMRVLDDQWENNVMQKMTQILNDATKQENPELKVTLEVTTVSLPVEVRDEAEANGVSSGKMAFWLISESQGHVLSMDTLKKQSLKKIAASWGGVNKVMSKYEQKKVQNVEQMDNVDKRDKVDKVDKVDIVDKVVKVDKVDKVDKGKVNKGAKNNENTNSNNSDKNNNSNGESNIKIKDKNNVADKKDNKKINKMDNEKDVNNTVNKVVIKDANKDINKVNEKDVIKEAWKQLLEDAKDSSDKPVNSGKEDLKLDQGKNDDEKNNKNK